jgi:phosphoglycolate phosphatase
MPQARFEIRLGIAARLAVRLRECGVTALIFDLDGTLVDSAPDIHAAVARMLAEEDAAPVPLEQVRSFIGHGVPALIARVMAARGEAPDEARAADLVARFMRHYEAAPVELTTVYPGVVEALATLDAAGHRLGLCTNKPAAAARAVLAAFGIDHHFAAVVGGDSVAQRKPHPAPLHAALRALGGGDVACVGDSEVDAQAAAAAAMPLLLFARGYRKTPVEQLPHLAAFDQFRALPALVASLVPSASD